MWTYKREQRFPLQDLPPVHLLFFFSWHWLASLSPSKSWERVNWRPIARLKTSTADAYRNAEKMKVELVCARERERKKRQGSQLYHRKHFSAAAAFGRALARNIEGLVARTRSVQLRSRRSRVTRKTGERLFHATVLLLPCARWRLSYGPRADPKTCARAASEERRRRAAYPLLFSRPPHDVCLSRGRGTCAPGFRHCLCDAPRCKVIYAHLMRCYATRASCSFVYGACLFWWRAIVMRRSMMFTCSVEVCAA